MGSTAQERPSTVTDDPLLCEVGHTPPTLWLDPIPAGFRGDAIARLEAGDVLGFLLSADNTSGLDLVAFNFAALQARGLYEQALLEAFISTRVNHHRWPLRTLSRLFGIADRARLRAAGDPLPGPGPFRLYRGVAGRGGARRIRGLSWSLSEEKARWFADRAALWELADPAVYRVTVEASDVLAYVNSDRVGRGEEEVIVLLPTSAKPVRMPNRELERAHEKGGA
jgi:hypothetical protein